MIDFTAILAAAFTVAAVVTIYALVLTEIRGPQ